MKGLALSLALVLGCSSATSTPSQGGAATDPRRDPADPHGVCRASAGCWHDARCSATRGGDCALQSDDDCRASAVACGQEGRCAHRGDGCVAAARRDCKASVVCTNEGRCTPDRGRCVAGSSADCADSPACRKWGRCIAVSGLCGRAAPQETERAALRRLEIVAMNAQTDRLLVRFETAAERGFLQLRLTDLKRLKVHSFESPAEELRLKRRLSRRFTVEGHRGQAGPAGGPVIAGAPSRMGFDILALRGARLGVVATLPVEPDAEVSVAEARWSPDGRLVAVVLRQRRTVEHGERSVDRLFVLGVRGAPIRWQGPGSSPGGGV